MKDLEFMEKQKELSLIKYQRMIDLDFLENKKMKKKSNLIKFLKMIDLE